ncbi:YqgE/AlgH family protein [Sandarakinorhabdus sp.]|uniref:YqgE/AlgH family protein n=1 Tax=Sandarakinorhabdus sp. TaxID=1916663 RepID=UPI00286E7E20|nr:YqgE/AlgH family protein [Sandarakinorhabdus sp.]
MTKAVTNAPFLSGQLLLSMPGMGDARFERVVIAMCLHDNEGALGLIVNQPLPDLTLRDLMMQLDIDPGVTPIDAPVMLGGPVEPGRGFVLHSPDYEGQSTILVSGGGAPAGSGSAGPAWALTATQDVLKDIAAGKGPRRWLATLGYTGWSAGQLDGEMTRHGWLAAPGDPELVFAAPVSERWARAYGQLGIAVGQLSATAGRA